MKIIFSSKRSAVEESVPWPRFNRNTCNFFAADYVNGKHPPHRRKNLKIFAAALINDFLKLGMNEEIFNFI